MRRQKLRRVVLLVRAGLAGAAILTLLIMWSSWSELRRDRPSANWPSTRGEILTDTAYWHRGGRHHSGYYSVDLTYAYPVGGLSYLGHRVRLWDPDLSRRSIPGDDFAKAHPAHSAVEVFYDPQRPSECALVTGADEMGGKLALYGGSCVELPLIIFAAFYAQRTYSRTRAQELPSYLET